VEEPEVNQMCAACHNHVWAAFQEPFTHKLAPGAMSCVDCHNPHGSFLAWQIRTVSANEPNCYQCLRPTRPVCFKVAERATSIYRDKANTGVALVDTPLPDFKGLHPESQA
jgi:hypothetical protein